MSEAYAEEVRLQCPQAQIVYDLFHVAVKYGREVVDRVRVDEANRLREDKPARAVVKGARWLLLRNRENIGKEDRVKLTDFGLARGFEDVRLTRTGFVSGTPLYMAPEQAHGENIDHRSDLFSLGSVLYEAATGRHPFEGKTPLAVLRRMEALPEVPWGSYVDVRVNAAEVLAAEGPSIESSFAPRRSKSSSISPGVW